MTPVTRSRSAWRGEATKSMPRRWRSWYGFSSAAISQSQPLHEPASRWRTWSERPRRRADGVGAARALVERGRRCRARPSRGMPVMAPPMSRSTSSASRVTAASSTAAAHGGCASRGAGPHTGGAEDAARRRPAATRRRSRGWRPVGQAADAGRDAVAAAGVELRQAARGRRQLGRLGRIAAASPARGGAGGGGGRGRRAASSAVRAGVAELEALVDEREVGHEVAGHRRPRRRASWRTTPTAAAAGRSSRPRRRAATSRRRRAGPPRRPGRTRPRDGVAARAATATGAGGHAARAPRG